MKYCFYCLFFVSMLTIFSCTNNHQNTTTSASTSKQTLDTADAHLANDLSVFYTSQIQAAKLLTVKSTNKKVIELAKQNEQLYVQMGNHLNNISDEYDIKLPAKISATAEENLLDLKISKLALLDHAYLLQMLKDHNAMIREMNTAKNIQCLPLKTFVMSNQSAIIKQAYALSALKENTP